MKQKQNKLDLSTTIVMGILNLTDNSFYDGGKFNTTEKAMHQARKMIQEGAKIIDIGAQSSKPGSKEISEEEEWNKLKDVIIKIKSEFKNILVSVDTYRSDIAEKSINNGADIINDISAGDLDKNMISVIAKHKVPYIIMHMQNTPKNMQENPKYNNVVEEITSYFKRKLYQLTEKGIEDIIIDPGFGFGKTIEHNYQLLKDLALFKNLDVPILAGISRKSMLYKPLGISPKEALNATTSANTIALLNGANLLRVHDVKEAIQAINIVNLLN